MGKKSSLFFLFLILLLSFFLIIYQSKGKLSAPNFNFSQISTSINYIKNLIKDFFYLREENDKLRKQLMEMSLQQKTYTELIDENKRLKELLGLKEQRKDILTIGKVISKGSKKYSKTIWIDKGSDHGVKKDLPVITPNGLVGKVISVSSGYSEILILTDPMFSVAIKIERTRAEGILSGKLNKCVIKYLPLEEKVLVGDRVVTSGLDGIFPEEIIVGVIKSVNKKEGLFQIIEVIPMQPENKIEVVAVIKKE
jgi:rod shape-determining protein MreC